MAASSSTIVAGQWTRRAGRAADGDSQVELEPRLQPLVQLAERLLEDEARQGVGQPVRSASGTNSSGASTPCSVKPADEVPQTPMMIRSLARNGLRLVVQEQLVLFS